MRLWEFGVQDCRLDQLTISLTITSLPLNESLHDAARAGLDFPRQSSRFYQINERRPRPGRFSTKLIFLYFSWCSFQSFFKKLTCLSCLAHAGENSWEIAKRELSNWQLLLSFLSNCDVQNSAENAVTWSRLSYLEMGGNIQISNLLKRSAIDVQSARVLYFAFSGYFTTLGMTWYRNQL